MRLLNAAMVNGFSIVTYQRPLKAEDELDRQIFTNGSQAIIWGKGPLNDKNEVGFHTSYLKGDRFIDFGRPPAWNCPTAEEQLAKQQRLQNEKLKNEQQLQEPEQKQQQYQEQNNNQNHEQQSKSHHQQQEEPQQAPPPTRRGKINDDKVTNFIYAFL